MRSVVVVLPASMWAMMPMFLTLLSGVFLATETAMISLSPPIVRECPIGFRHPVRILTPLDARPDVILRVQDLAGQPAAHRLLPARPRVADHPTQRQRVRTPRDHLDRHLVRRPADPAALHLDAWPDVLQRVVQHAHGVRAGALLDIREGVVDDLLGHAFLAVEHHLVDDLLHQHAPVYGVARYLPLRRRCSPRHLSPYLFVPYLDRPCLRLLTPKVSSAPRTTL